MAEEEERPLDEGADGVDAPEDNTVDLSDDAPADDAIAKLASELGWLPKEQFKGNPDEWKPADEFIRAGRNIQRSLSRELREVRSTVSNIERTSASLLEQRLAEQRRELESRFSAAVEEGDAAAAKQASDALGMLKLQAPASMPEITPEAESFVERNSRWFGKDREATAFAVNRAEHYANQGLSAARQLAAVEQDMKGLFPDLFPAPAKGPPSVAAPPSRAATPSNRKKGFHDLPPEAQKIARDMAERGVIPSTDIYVANFFKEKVG